MLRYNFNMDYMSRDKRLRKEENAARFRRMRTALFVFGGMFLSAFVFIPFLFDLYHPITAYQDIQAPVMPAAAGTPVPAPSPTPTPAAMISAEAVLSPAVASTTLQLGDEDPRVAEIQVRLMELGYLDGDEPTELFGEQTQAALQRFQRTHYMAQSGVADELTQSILFSADARMYSLEEGNKGTDVKKLQNQLNDLGYYEAKVNGYFGVATVRALGAFQVKNKLSESGVADGDTLDVLYSASARPKIDPTPTPKPKTPKPTKTPKPGAGSSWDTGNQPTTALTPPPDVGGYTPVGAGAEAFISTAMAQEGKPYVYSAEGPDSYDCSGLVYYSLKSVGVNVGRLSAKHFAAVDSWLTIPSKSQLARGDLLFFTNSAGSATIGHTGIYLGNSKFIHASSSAGKVVVSTWSPWCEQNFQWGKRLF